MVALSSISHRETNTERAPAANEIFMVLQEVDFLPLSKTPSFTSSVILQSGEKQQQQKLVKMNSVIRNNLNTIQQNNSQGRRKVTECINQSSRFVKEDRLQANLLHRDASGSDLKKEHCLYLSSDYKVGLYKEYYGKRLSQIECVLNTSALLQ